MNDQEAIHTAYSKTVGALNLVCGIQIAFEECDLSECQDRIEFHERGREAHSRQMEQQWRKLPPGKRKSEPKWDPKLFGEWGDNWLPGLVQSTVVLLEPDLAEANAAFDRIRERFTANPHIQECEHILILIHCNKVLRLLQAFVSDRPVSVLLSTDNYDIIERLKWLRDKLAPMRLPDYTRSAIRMEGEREKVLAAIDRRKDNLTNSPESEDSNRLRDGDKIANTQWNGYVDQAEIAALVKLKSSGMEPYKRNGMPAADREGGGGKKALWKWETIRPWIESEFNIELPAVNPFLQFHIESR